MKRLLVGERGSLSHLADRRRHLTVAGVVIVVNVDGF